MLWLYQLCRHFGPPLGVVLFCGLAGCRVWASEPEPPKLCPAWTSSTIRTQNGEGGTEKKNNPSAEPPGAYLRNKNQAGRNNIVSSFCLVSFTHNLMSDQKTIWTSPFHLPALPSRDRNWLVPLSVGAAGLVAADQNILHHLGSTPMSHSGSFSNYGLAALAGGAATFYLRGTTSGDAHSRETGLLAGEAAINSVLVGEGLKLVFERPRPNERNAGSFGAGGSSFPSEHALAAWSMATVIAHEYPGRLTKLLAYGTATGISLARVADRKHFPSDVVVGSALGYLIGRYVYRAHHDPELAGASENPFKSDLEQGETSRARTPAELGSPFVPLDSWVYAAFDRMAALGYAPSAFANLRPWTRMECARIVAAGDDL